MKLFTLFLYIVSTKAALIQKMVPAKYQPRTAYPLLYQYHKQKLYQESLDRIIRERILRKFQMAKVDINNVKNIEALLKRAEQKIKLLKREDIKYALTQILNDYRAVGADEYFKRARLNRKEDESKRLQYKRLLQYTYYLLREFDQVSVASFEKLFNKVLKQAYASAYYRLRLIYGAKHLPDPPARQPISLDSDSKDLQLDIPYENISKEIDKLTN